MNGEIKAKIKIVTGALLIIASLYGVIIDDSFGGFFILCLIGAVGLTLIAFGVHESEDK